MTNKKALKIISNALNCMTTVKRQLDDKEISVFKTEVIQSDIPEYKILSDIIYNADYSRDSAYSMVHDGLYALQDIIGDLEPNEDFNTDDISDNITEYVDGLVPIYYHDLDTWFSDGNRSLVDEAIAEFGKSDDLSKDIQMAYFMTQERIIYSLIDKLLS